MTTEPNPSPTTPPDQVACNNLLPDPPPPATADPPETTLQAAQIAMWKASGAVSEFAAACRRLKSFAEPMNAVCLQAGSLDLLCEVSAAIGVIRDLAKKAEDGECELTGKRSRKAAAARSAAFH